MARTNALLLRTLLVIAGAFALGACAVDRPALQTDELELRKRAYLRDTHEYLVRASRKLAARCKMEWDDYQAGKTAEKPTIDVLILSGGGDYGAFGAGILQGWGTIEGDMARPEFDVVTGVSTGALIAPFAFVGDDNSYTQVDNLYRSPKKDWVSLRDIFFFLPGRESFMSIDGLKRDIAREVSPEVIQRIAEGSRQNRVLAIGTTNLDLGINKPWLLDIACERACETGNYDRIHQILCASSAIPAAFPPVVIDDTLYVDGGTTANILFSANMRTPNSMLSVLHRVFPEVPPPRIRYWVIINNQLGAIPQVVQPTWLSITGASVSTAIRSSTLGSLRHLDAEIQYSASVDKVDAELYFVSIPDDWRAPKPGIFEQETMAALADLGRKMGSDTSNWRTSLATTPSRATPSRPGRCRKRR